ncbi:hypothetical protein FRC20_001097 [Serendipita sp. 405]|nr:hypothetical protein FRC15_010782 [Serendipita sp. 397]KAG8854078.1 hypothetical protein FRC20_001097 [Serendipita sp. 405]
MDDTNPIYTVRVDEDEPVRLGDVAPRFLQRCDPLFSKTNMVYAKHRVIFNVTNERPNDVRDVVFQGMIVTTPDPQDGIAFNSTEQFSNSTSTAPGGMTTTTTSSNSSSGSKPSLLSQIIGTIIGFIFWIAVGVFCYRKCCKGNSTPRIPRPRPQPQPQPQLPLAHAEQYTRPAPKTLKSPKVAKAKANAKEEDIPLPLFRNSRAVGTRSSLNTTDTTNTNTNTNTNSIVGPPPYSPMTHPEVANANANPTAQPTPSPFGSSSFLWATSPLNPTTNPTTNTTTTTTTNNNKPVSPPAPAVTRTSSITRRELRRPRSIERGNTTTTTSPNPLSNVYGSNATGNPTSSLSTPTNSLATPNPTRAQSPAWQDSSEALD